ncbi:MAG: hypothetical protein E7100_02780 [Bacteroidaceae bacterium]|nr:hypothetical protein [Bacteroidaceae bacterium]
MRNETKNLPTAAVISDRQATGGSDIATSPACQHPVDNISKNYPCPAVMPAALPVHVLCSDPYAWFSQRGQRLHSCSIGILPSPRSNGVLYTGEFNIDGFIYTVGATSVDGLYHEAMQKRCRHLQGIHVRQQRKRARCATRYRERYPGAELPRWFAPSEN